MSWLSSAFKRNRGWISNAVKNFAPVAGILTGGLGGIALGGLGSALGRGIGKGANLGNILGQGLSGAAITGAGQGALGGLKSLFAPSSAATTGAAAQAGAPSMTNIGGMTVKAPVAAPLSIPKPPAPSMVSRIGAGASKVGKFASDNPTAAAMALQGAGEAMNAPSENRYRDAQTRALEAQTASEEEERKRRQRMEEALEPLRQLLAGQLAQGSKINVPSNPWA